MLRLYLALGAVAIALAGLWYVKSVIQENGVLEQKLKQKENELKQMEELKIEAENNTVFQQNLGMLKDSKIGSLMAAKKENANDLQEWKTAYNDLLAKSAAARDWANQPLPADVHEFLRQRKDRHKNEVRSRDEAEQFVRRLREAEGQARENR